jgi:vacuolar protein sorting-associated protein 13A/C
MFKKVHSFCFLWSLCSLYFPRGFSYFRFALSFAGIIGKLKLQVPWKNLKSEPVVVLIEDVFILCKPQYNYNEVNEKAKKKIAHKRKKKEEKKLILLAQYNEEEELKRQHKIKMEKLANAQLMKDLHRRAENEKEEQKNASFLQRLATKVIDNLQVHISKIHIMLEDTSSKDVGVFFF